MATVKSIEFSRDPKIKAYRTYLNYLDAYCRAIHKLYGDQRSFFEACLATSRGIQGKRGSNDWVERFLPIAWNTEYLLYQAPIDDPGLLRIANHWLPVQAYYALYCGAEAAGAVLDGNPPRAHARAMKSLTAYLSKTRLLPWNLCACGHLGRDGNGISFKNLPEGSRLPHNLETDAEPIGMLAKCFRAEHRHRIADQWEDVKKNSVRPKKYELDPGDTGLLQFLYRLRIKANYREVDVFLADVTDVEIVRFAEAFRTITSTGLTLVEVILMRRMGKHNLIQIGRRYLKKNSGAMQLSARLDQYLTPFHEAS